MFKSVFSSSRDLLSPHTALEVAKIHLEHARQAKNPELALTLCNDAEAGLSRIKRAAKKALLSPPFSVEDQTLRVGFATTYFEHGKLVESLGYRIKAQASYKKAQKWGWLAQEPGLSSTRSEKGTTLPNTDPSAAQLLSVPTPLPTQDGLGRDIGPVSPHIFAEDMHPPPGANKLPEPEDRLYDIRQLVYCLDLLRSPQLPDDTLDQPVRKWLKAIENDREEQERLKMLSTNLLREFAREELKDAKAVAEVVYLVPVLDKSDLQQLLQRFFHGIEQSDLLDFNLLEGLAQLVQGAPPDHLNADNLIKILELISTRLRGTHGQSPDYIYQLTLTVSHALDAMADSNVKGLDRETLHAPLGSYLQGLKGNTDPYLVYQAAYASQALLYVPDNETPWQATIRRTGKVVKGISGLVSAVKGLDLNSFVEGLGNIQEGIAGVSEFISLAKSAYDDVGSLAESGQDFLDCLKEGLTFNRKRAWYSALRGADVFLRNGQLTMFQRLVYEAPCRLDPAFQWGVCQRLGELAANPECDDNSRKSAVAFLGEMYQNDAIWGQHANVKQWIINILMQLASMPGNANEAAETQLQELEKNGDAKKQALYHACREKGPTLHPLKAALPEFASPSLLDRVQNKPDVEGALRRLKNRRIKDRGEAVYIPPQAKASLQARDDTLSPLMEKVKEFLSSNRKVLLLLGDSGAGKSTFNRALERDLWSTYTKDGLIPLYINLPTIDKPEHDLITKHLRKSGFNEAQIMELNAYRKFILICDGYDESKQTHNLYTTNQLNQSAGGWKAQMVVSCRSEYLGRDYRDRFQPSDRKPGTPILFQELVIAPFSPEQVKDYISQYVSANTPQWGVKDYLDALKRIPSMSDLVTNPFLLTLSLEVLPRMVNPGQNLSTARVTRVSLYDQFVELWLERSKKRLGEKDLTHQEKKAFERLSDESFTQNGISFLKKFAEAIYKEQGGHPVVEYAHFKDEGTWKDEFFCQDDVKDLLREACPLTRSGNQYRFIHRSLLEYGLARAVFEPQERGNDQKKTEEPTETAARRRSVDSIWSFEAQETVDEAAVAISQEPDIMSPLVWRSFVNDPSILQFLEERVRQEPLFKEQLLAYIEHSKIDKKWRTAAANAISILVKAGTQFTGMDLQGVQIPGADLSNGVFDSAQFQGADLRKVKVRNAWLRGAYLDGARMAGVQFGELPFLKEDSEVWSCLYSPDGKILAVGHYNGTITIYKTSTWEKTKLSSDGMDSVRGVLYSPKGGQIVSFSDDRIVRLWDLETGACSRTLTGHDSMVREVAYSPNGDQLVSCSDDRTVRLWDVETGVCRHTLAGHSHFVGSIAFSPVGDQVASGSDDKTVRLWDIETGDCLHTLTGHTSMVWGVVYSPKGDQIASRSTDYTSRLWDVGTGACQRTLRGHESTVTALLYSPKGDQIASGSEDCAVRLWDVESGDCRHNLTGHSSRILSVMYSPKGSQIASCSDDDTARLWDVETGDCLHILSGHNGPVRSVAYSPTGDQVATGSDDMTVRLWGAEAGPIRQTLSSQTGAVLNVVYSPTGDHVVSGGEDGTVQLWDVKSGDCRHTLSGHSSVIESIAYSPTGDIVVSGSDDATVRLWDVETGTCRVILSGHISRVLSVAYSPDGSQIASGGDDGTVRLWDVEAGTNSYTLHKHSGRVMSVKYSPIGDQVASGGDDGTVRIWSAKTGECLHILGVEGNGEPVSNILYSPKGDQIASVVGGITLWLWDVETKACRHILAGHEMPISSFKYSPSGDQIVTGSWDLTVRLWDARTGDCHHTFAGHNEWIRGVVYSPKGDRVASCGSDNIVQLWDVASGQRLAVIQNYVGVNSIAWKNISGGSYLVVGCAGGSILMWKIIENESECCARLVWRFLADVLSVSDTSIQDTKGLSPQDKQLLRQRGAVGEPTPPISFREAGKRVASMLSAASKLRLPSNREILQLDASRAASTSAGRSDMRVI